MKSLLFIIPLLMALTTFGQDRNVAIEDFSMLTGTWRGTGFGSDLEEIWSGPSSGIMMGMFRIENDGEIVLYEFMNIIEEEDGFELKVKHFNPSFHGWEVKNEYLTFPLVDISEQEIRFEGLVIQQISSNELLYLLNVTQEDGSERVEELRYQRVSN